MEFTEVRPGAVVRGPLFPEPVQVIVCSPLGDSVKLIGKGLDSGRVYEPVLDAGQLAVLEISPEEPPFDADAMHFRLGIEALRLASACEDDKVDVRTTAAEALDKLTLETTVAIPTFTRLLDSRCGDVRALALRALEKRGSLTTEMKVRQYARNLTDLSSNIRRRTSAAWILGSIGSQAKTAVPALMETLKDEDPDVRSAAAEALGDIGIEAKGAAAVLLRVIEEDANAWVRGKAAKALEKVVVLTEALRIRVGLGTLLTYEIRDEEAHLEKRTGINPLAKTNLVRIGGAAVPALVKALQGKDPLVREAAAEVLGEIGAEAKDAIPALEGLLEDEWRIRSAATWAIESIQRRAKTSD